MPNLVVQEDTAYYRTQIAITALVLLVTHFKLVKAVALDVWKWIETAATNTFDWIKHAAHDVAKTDGAIPFAFDRRQSSLKAGNVRVNVAKNQISHRFKLMGRRGRIIDDTRRKCTRRSISIVVRRWSPSEFSCGRAMFRRS